MAYESWHISKDNIEITSDDKVNGIDLNATADTIECRPCMESKQTKSGANETLAKGNVHHAIHTDIIGLNRPNSLGEASYIICSIVETSRFGKVYVMKRRSEVSNCF